MLRVFRIATIGYASILAACAGHGEQPFASSPSAQMHQQQYTIDSAVIGKWVELQNLGVRLALPRFWDELQLQPDINSEPWFAMLPKAANFELIAADLRHDAACWVQLASPQLLDTLRRTNQSESIMYRGQTVQLFVVLAPDFGLQHYVFAKGYSQTWVLSVFVSNRYISNGAGELLPDVMRNIETLLGSVQPLH